MKLKGVIFLIMFAFSNAILGSDEKKQNESDKQQPPPAQMVEVSLRTPDQQQAMPVQLQGGSLAQPPNAAGQESATIPNVAQMTPHQKSCLAKALAACIVCLDPKTLVKAGTYRIVAICGTIGVAWYITGNPNQSFAIGGLNSAVATFNYWWYDRLFPRIWALMEKLCCRCCRKRDGQENQSSCSSCVMCGHIKDAKPDDDEEPSNDGLRQRRPQGDGSGPSAV